MINSGDIYLADLNDEQRRLALVVSNDRFHRRSERAIIAPELIDADTSDPTPWLVEVDGVVFALDFIVGVPSRRLLEQRGRATATQMSAVRRAIRHLT